MATERIGPLVTLAGAMRQSAPPSLHHLLQWLDQGADFREFVLLTRQYLPEHAAEILGEAGVNVQIATFAQRFRERYFDLMDEFTDGVVEEYEYLTACIPIQRLGISWDDYHDLAGWRPGYQLLLALPQDPTVDPGRQGPRVALLEACAEVVPAALLERTGQGYTREQLHQRLDGTKFEAAALAADWLCGDTDNAFLDVDETTPLQEEWNPETVRVLTDHWARARDVRDRIHSLAEWLEVEQAERFRELLDRIEGEPQPQYDPRQLTLPGREFQREGVPA
ncbi:MAG: hypothetical protein Q8O40_13120 [Chloroflexota bacterium]|nr:hypothetical protein [Chloroflexota bacterium]